MDLCKVTLTRLSNFSTSETTASSSSSPKAPSSSTKASYEIYDLRITICAQRKRVGTISRGLVLRYWTTGAGECTRVDTNSGARREATEQSLVLFCFSCGRRPNPGDLPLHLPGGWRHQRRFAIHCLWHHRPTGHRRLHRWILRPRIRILERRHRYPI